MLLKKLVAITLFAASGNLFAAEFVQKRDKVEVNPISPLIGNLSVRYHRLVTEQDSVGVKLSATQLETTDKEKVSGFEGGLIVSRALTLADNTPFIRGEGSSARLTLKDEVGASATVRYNEARGLAGYSWNNPVNGLGASIAAGVAYKNGEVEGARQDLKIANKTFKVEKGHFAAFHPDVEIGATYQF